MARSSKSADGNSSAVAARSWQLPGNANGSEFVSTFSDSQVSKFDADSDQRSYDRIPMQIPAVSRTATARSLSMAVKSRRRVLFARARPAHRLPTAA